jgi:hypothetical protein
MPARTQRRRPLKHPNICTLFDIGPDYLVMEYIDGAPPRGPLVTNFRPGLEEFYSTRTYRRSLPGCCPGMKLILWLA